MSNRLERLLEDIQKTAQVPTRSKGDRVPPPAAAPEKSKDEPAAPASAPETSGVPTRGKKPAAAPASASAVSASNSLPAVKEMQQAILNFAAVAASTDVTSMTGNQHGLKEGPQTRTAPGQFSGKQTVKVPKVDAEGNTEKDSNGQPIMINEDQTGQFSALKNTQEQLGGSDPFGDFIVQQYVANDPRGSQYLNVDVSGKKGRGEASIENLNLRGIIDTISRVGTPGVNGGEKSVDGVWAYRTDHALQGITILTKAMLDFAKDLKVQTRYTEKDLANFTSVLPKSYTELKNPAEKSSKAKYLTEHINAITSFFKELKKEILNNREHRQYIDQKKPFVQYKQNPKKSAKEILDPKEMSAFTENQMQGIPQVGFSGVGQKDNWISLKELSDMNSFKGFMNRIGKGKEAENPAEVKKWLDIVSSQVGADFDPKAGY